MKNHKTPKPGSAGYNIEKTNDLNAPEYHSSTDRRSSHELPAAENLNDQPEKTSHEKLTDKDLPKADLGNKRQSDEDEQEKIITP